MDVDLDFVLQHLDEKELHPLELAARFVKGRVDRLSRRVEAAVGDVINLDCDTVLLPVHKKTEGMLRYLSEVDPALALGGSEGESETFAVLLRGTRLLVQGIVEKPMDDDFRLYFYRGGPVEGFKIGSNSWGMDNKEERRACEEGQRLHVCHPPRRVYLEVLVEAVPGFVAGSHSEHCVRPASEEDCTDGFVLTAGVRGFIDSMQIVCPPEFSWRLDDAPNPAHPDHDEYREHKRVLQLMRRLRLQTRHRRRHLPFQRRVRYVVDVDEE